MFSESFRLLKQGYFKQITCKCEFQGMKSCIFSFYHGFFSEKSNNKCNTVQLDLQNSNCRNCTNNSPENFHPITWNSPAEFLQFMRHYRFCGCFLHNCKCYMPYLKNFRPNGYPPFVCKFCTKNGTGRISAYNISCQKKYKERTRVTRYYNANHYRYAISCLNPSGFGQTNYAGIFDFGIW